jgi:anti-sigma-K factor RskA
MSGGMECDSATFWKEDPEGVAGEYVLGTLPADERAAFARALERDASLRAIVADWEARLSPLADAVPALVPDPRVWDAIEARIGAGSTERPSARPAEEGGARILRLERGLRRWRIAAGMAGALAAGLALWIAAPRFAPDGQRYLAVVDRGGTLPALIVRVDLGDGTVQVRSFSTEAPPDRSLQLWYVGADAPPRSLGLLTDAARLSLPASLPGAAEGGTLAVSVEPKGGSPTGAPTGPVVYSGRLVRE